jgi:hypothetical protein
MAQYNSGTCKAQKVIFLSLNSLLLQKIVSFPDNEMK